MHVTLLLYDGTECRRLVGFNLSKHHLMVGLSALLDINHTVVAIKSLDRVVNIDLDLCLSK